MSEPTLTWTRSSVSIEVAEIPGGRLALHAGPHAVELTYQSDRPAGMSGDSAKLAKAAQRPTNRRYWDLAAIAPGWSMSAGGFQDADLAKDLIARAMDREPGQNGSHMLEAAGYHATTTDEYGGLRWVRRTGLRNDVIVTNAHRVYALVEPRTMAAPKVIFDLALDNRIVERGIGVKPVSVHYVWPAFMDSIDALTLMALDALNRTH